MKRFIPVQIYFFMLFSVMVASAQMVTDKKMQQSLISQEKLNGLFDKLKQTQNDSEAKFVESQIWDIWMESGNQEIDKLMEKGCKAMEKKEYTQSVDYFTQMIEKMPDYAEGWNKRATAYYLQGNFKKSIDDVEKTLALEKRHFGALSGLVNMYINLGDDKGLLKTLEKLLKIRPNQPELEKYIENLQRKLGIKKT